MRSQQVNLCEGNLAKKLLIFAIPLLISNFLQQVYDTANLLILGNFAGKLAVGAVGACSYLISTMIGFFIGLGTGASVVVAQCYGAEEPAKLSRAIHTAMALAFVMGALLSALAYFFAPQILILLGTPAELLPDASSYIRLYFLGAVSSITYNVGAGILRSVGDLKRPLYFLISGVVANILLSLLFVAKWQMGVQGAALATLLAQTLTAILVVLTLVRSDGLYKLYWRQVRFYRDELRLILRIGIPAGLQTVLVNLSNLYMQSKFNSFGATAVTGIAVGSRIDSFVFMMINALSLSVMTAVGQNAGARQMTRMRQSFYLGLGMILVGVMSLSGVLLYFSADLAALFNRDVAVIQQAQQFLWYLLPLYVIFGLNETLSAALRGSGKSMQPMLITLICVCLLRVVWIYVVLPLKPELDTVLVAYPMAWIVTFLVLLIYLIRNKWGHELKDVLS